MAHFQLTDEGKEKIIALIYLMVPGFSGLTMSRDLIHPRVIDLMRTYYDSNDAYIQLGRNQVLRQEFEQIVATAVLKCTDDEDTRLSSIINVCKTDRYLNFEDLPYFIQEPFDIGIF